MVRRLSLSRTFVGVTIIFGITFFFWNLTLYSDQLCDHDLRKVQEEKNEIATSLLSELRNSEKERASLSEELQQLSRELRHKEEILNKVSSLKELEGIDFTKSKSTKSSLMLPVIVFAYDRPNYLNRTIQTLLKYLPKEPLDSAQFPIFISQDGDVASVTNLIKSYPQLFHLKNTRRTPKKKEPTEPDSYYFIAQHYGFGLKTLLGTLQYDAAIILEDDLEISPDFFSYFRALYDLLQKDQTLYCVSAWNDNGQEDRVEDPTALYRSNFFPGLGWMLTRELWNELGPHWPEGYWDDWMREPEQRKGRDCIRPEISRTYTFGEKGSSGGQFFGRYLKKIKLNSVPVRWQDRSFSFLLKDEYDKRFQELLASATEIHNKGDIKQHRERVLIYYYDRFSAAAKLFGVMDDSKAGVPRGAYNGVVTFRSNPNQILLAPKM